ncbi:hypothetical protein [Nocardioides dilutus]
MSADDPSPDEAVAYAVVESILGARVEHHDRGGRQAVVDAFLHLSDRRCGALEVTSVRSADRLSLDSALAKIRHRLPAVGRWTWYITIPPGVKLRDVESRYGVAQRWFEQQGMRSSVLQRHREAPDEVIWLRKAKVRMHASVESDLPPRVFVLAAGDGGFADETLDTLRDSLADIFASPSIQSRLRKLLAVDADERHMFIWITIGGLPFPLLDGIGRGDALPSAPPPVPAALDGLWLGTEFGRRVIVWRDNEWTAQPVPAELIG